MNMIRQYNFVNKNHDPLSIDRGSGRGGASAPFLTGVVMPVVAVLHAGAVQMHLHEKVDALMFAPIECLGWETAAATAAAPATDRQCTCTRRVLYIQNNMQGAGRGRVRRSAQIAVFEENTVGKRRPPPTLRLTTEHTNET